MDSDTPDAYRVVCFRHLVNLELVVNQAMQDGWRPVGGVTCVETPAESEPLFAIDKDGTTTIAKASKSSTRLWAQALLREDKRTEDNP